MLALLPLLLFLASGFAASEPDICEILDLKNCAGVTKQTRRSSSLSLPSPITAALFNPSNVSQDKGIGVEAIYHAGNPVLVNLASGSGKVGGALISSSLENTFFSNRVFELEDTMIERNEDEKQYKSKKLNLAGGVNLIRKRHLSLDVGVIAKRHSDVKDINLGGGASVRLGIFNFGVSQYKDDIYFNLVGREEPETSIPYYLIYGGETYKEKFLVTSYSGGVRLSRLSLDAGVIKTKYKQEADEESLVHIYSGSLNLRNIMLNAAYRNEINPSRKYIDDRLQFQKTKSDWFYGVQVSFGKHIILGVNYNYFLLQDTSFTGTIFF